MEKKIALIKFIYSEKATKFCEISTLLVSNVVPVESKVEISQNFVAFSEYMNFTKAEKCLRSSCPNIYYSKRTFWNSVGNFIPPT